eukprot:COSAG02_NODE_14130_length_1307_cov_0.874172_2_plen_26_part_01
MLVRSKQRRHKMVRPGGLVTNHLFFA